MKIAIVTDAIYPYMVGGSEIRNHEIAKRLVKKGHDVHIYGVKLWEGSDEKVVEGVRIHGVSKYRRLYNSRGKRNVLAPLILSLKLPFYLSGKKFDIIETAAFNSPNCFSTWFISKVNDSKLVFVWHQFFGNYFLDYFGTVKGTIAKFIEKWTTFLTPNNICVSKHAGKCLETQGVMKKNIQVIYNGVDFSLINSAKPSNKKYDLIFVGRLNYQKNLKLLINSVNLLVKDFPKLRVCVIGEGAERDNLISLICEKGLESHFDFLGRVDNRKKVISYMKSSKIFVLPSRLEGFPLTIVEANAAGLPIITTKTKYNNTSEYVKHGVNGMLTGLDKTDFSLKVKTLLENPKLRNKLSRNGRKISKDFDWDRIADEIEDYYLDVLRK
ncbi:glycosyltransferase family 4 protein [archaeon]|nr:glycosyltransferase family 4 protein [archaeon]